MDLTDYHTHTPLCLHAEGAVSEYVQAAQRARLVHFGIADHAPMPDDDFDDWRMKASDLPAYLDWLAEAKTLLEGSTTELRCGLECDWIPNIEPWIEHLQQQNNWDYLIGSVHYLDNKWDFDNPQSLNFWSQTSVESAWDRYWELYLSMINSRLFTIAAHADLIRKFGHRPEGDLKRYYIPVTEALANTGMVLELNTAGWHKPCAEQYPCFDFLVLAREADIPIVINSDAHSPSEVARDFAQALELIKKAGFTHLARLTQGHITRHPILD